jgi:uncharacterized protein (TIGR00297 family)
MSSDLFLLSAILIAGILLSILSKKLTVAAAITGGIIGLLVFTGAGYTGIIMMAAFFILGSAATSWKIKTKQQLGLAETNKGRRTAAQVIANAGVPAILGMLAYFYPLQKGIFNLMTAAAFSSATADTLSSELGNIYGSKFYNIITFKKDERGLNGVVSIEGTMFGFAGSIIIAVTYAIGHEWNMHYIILIIAGGTAGNIADSVIGATAERKELVANNTVNFFNTVIAAITALLIFYII